MLDRDTLLLAALRRLDPERAHGLAINALLMGWGGGAPPADDPALSVRALGLRFPNPIGIAAGFDKNAQVIRPLARLGFGFVEAGSVTPLPQSGNPRPRLFRLLEDGAVINRMGFNNCGIDRFAVRLARLHRPMPSGKVGGAGVPVGANLGINKTGADPLRDYPVLVGRVKQYVDYVTINLSSPNTPGLRDLQQASRLQEILEAIATAQPERPPILVKIAPDLADEALSDVIEAVIAGGAQGLIVSNTTLARPDTLMSAHRGESGGLSGRPLRDRAQAMLGHVARIAAGRLVLVGAGGIETGVDILNRVKAGADLVQLYSAFALQGPALIPRLKRELLAAMRAEGFETLVDAKGVDL